MDQVGWFSIVYGPANQSVRSKKKKKEKKKKKKGGSDDKCAIWVGGGGWGCSGRGGVNLNDKG